VRQHLFLLKCEEAKILKMLIINDKKNIQFKKVLPSINSIVINQKYVKPIKLISNNHIEPNSLNIVKDVYVDSNYLSESCDYEKNGNFF